MEYNVIDLGFGTGMSQNLLFIQGNLAQNGVLRAFFVILSTAHAQKRPEYYFRFQNGPRIRNRHARKPIYREI